MLKYTIYLLVVGISLLVFFLWNKFEYKNEHLYTSIAAILFVFNSILLSFKVELTQQYMSCLIFYALNTASIIPIYRILKSKDSYNIWFIVSNAIFNFVTIMFFFNIFYISCIIVIKYPATTSARFLHLLNFIYSSIILIIEFVVFALTKNLFITENNKTIFNWKLIIKSWIIYFWLFSCLELYNFIYYKNLLATAVTNFVLFTNQIVMIIIAAGFVITRTIKFKQN